MNVLDLTFLLICLFLALVSAKKGFFAELLRFVSVAGAGALAKYLSKPVAGICYTLFAQKRITNKLSEIIPTGNLSGNINSIIEKIKEFIPDFFIDIATKFGIDMNSLVVSDGSYSVDKIESEMISPVFTAVFALIAFILLFVIFSFVFSMLANYLCNKRKKKRSAVINTVDMVLGGFLGFGKSVVIVAILCTVMNILSVFFDDAGFAGLIDGSYCCQIIKNIF